jgi:hypothetical protein
MKPEAKPPVSEEFDRFTALVDQVLSVPHSEIEKRQEEYQRQQEASLTRRGPKPKKNA